MRPTLNTRVEAHVIMGLYDVETSCTSINEANVRKILSSTPASQKPTRYACLKVKSCFVNEQE